MYSHSLLEIRHVGLSVPTKTGMGVLFDDSHNVVDQIIMAGDLQSDSRQEV
jgi:hypothetical protein